MPENKDQKEWRGIKIPLCFVTAEFKWTKGTGKVLIALMVMEGLVLTWFILEYFRTR